MKPEALGEEIATDPGQRRREEAAVAHIELFCVHSRNKPVVVSLQGMRRLDTGTVS
jgi:hypothetical protein